jgi:DNA-binding ferritin-like protein (Dps family)
VVLLGREFGWSIEEMRQLTPRELAVVLNELQRQVAIEQYNEQHNKWAFLAAVITNNISRIIDMFSKKQSKRVEPDDFMGKDAKKMLQRLLGQEQEQKDWGRHIEDAKAKGLKGGETLC